jgi:SAM-dependent methyltransferase
MTRDAWSNAKLYEPFIGRWSRLVAAELVSWLDPPDGLNWLDVGCGTGALSEVVLGRAAPASLTGVDPSEAYIAQAAERLAGDNVTFRVGDAAALPLPDASVDRVVCGLVLNFVPDPGAALREMRRVLIAGGVAAAYVWDYSDGMQILRRFWDAAIAEDPSAAELDEGARFAICSHGGLRACFTDAGMVEVAERSIEVACRFRDFDDYWAPFLGGQGPAPGYCSALSPQARERLRARLQSTLPTSPDGSINLTARAWAVVGTATKRSSVGV